MVLKIELYKDIARLIFYQDKNGESNKFTLRKLYGSLKKNYLK